MLAKYESIVASANPNNLIEAYKVRIVNSRKNISMNMAVKISAYHQKEIILQKNLKNSLFNKLDKKVSKFEFYANKLNLFNPVKKLDSYRYKLDIIEKSLLRAVREKYAALNRQLKDNTRLLEQCMVDYLFNKNADISLFESKLNLLDPKNVIERGYAVVTQNNNIVSSVDKVEKDTEITVTLKDGFISAYPEKISKNNIKNDAALNNIEKILK